MALDRIIIGADHGGYALKESLKDVLREQSIGITDVGTDSDAAVDYPDIAGLVARRVASGEFPRGILICGSGAGMVITANRFPGIRAVLALTEDMAQLSRAHNDANILVLAGRLTDPDTGANILRTWIATPYEGGRHEKRLDKIRQIEDSLTHTTNA